MKWGFSFRLKSKQPTFMLKKIYEINPMNSTESSKRRRVPACKHWGTRGNWQTHTPPAATQWGPTAPLHFPGFLPEQEEDRPPNTPGVALLINYKNKTNSERKTQVAQNCRKHTRSPSSPKALPSDLTFRGQRPDSDRLSVTQPQETPESQGVWSQHAIQLPTPSSQLRYNWPPSGRQKSTLRKN